MNRKNKNPLVSLITVNYNGLHYLKELFNSLSRLNYQPVEIIMVDNASTDGSVAYVQKHYPGVKVIANQENYMFARGNNLGIREARGEIICLINNDVVVDPDFLTPIVRAFQEMPEMAICQPKVLDLNNPEMFEYAGGAGGFLDRFGYPFLKGRIFFTLEKDRGQYNHRQEIFWASGAAFCIRQSVLAETGLLDEDFFMHMEEIDLCWRTHLLGWKIFLIPEAKIWHKGGGTLQQEHPRKLYWNFRNNIFLLVKNLSLFNLVRILPLRVLLDGAAFWGEILKGNFPGGKAILKAYFWLIRHGRLLREKRRQIQKIRKVSDREIFKLIYPGSVVWEYFVRGRKTFSNLKKIEQISSKVDGKNMRRAPEYERENV